jgi:hypothetical protein
MTIRAYNDIEFHAKVQELALLDSNANFGYISSNDVQNGVQDLHVQNRFEHSYRSLCNGSKKIVSFVTRFFSENECRLTAGDLPYLEAIASYMQNMGDSAIPLLSKRCYEYHNRLIFFPPELLGCIATTNQLFLSLRATCKSLAASLDITRLCSLQRVSYGNAFDVYTLAGLIYKLVKNRRYESARFIVEQFLHKATSDSQNIFWGYFARKKRMVLEQLFDRPFDLVTMISSNTELVSKSLIGLFSKIIESCPNVQSLHMHGFGKGPFSKSLLASIVNSNKLTELDIPNFCITEVENVFKVLVHSTALKQLRLRAIYSQEIQECMTAKGAVFSGIALEFVDDVPRFMGVRNIFERCINLRSFHINHVGLLPQVPSHIKELEITLSGNVQDFEIISWLRGVPLPSLEILSIATCGISDAFLDVLLKSAMHFKNLRSLKIGKCRVGNLSKVLAKLEVLSRRLDFLQIYLKVPDFRGDEVAELNRSSRLTKLILDVELDDEMHPFKQMHALFCVCNPQKLLFKGIMYKDEDYYFRMQYPSTAFVKLESKCAKVNVCYIWAAGSRLEEFVLEGDVDFENKGGVQLPCAVIDYVDQMGSGTQGRCIVKNGH